MIISLLFYINLEHHLFLVKNKCFFGSHVGRYCFQLYEKGDRCPLWKPETGRVGETDSGSNDPENAIRKFGEKNLTIIRTCST